MYRFHLWFFLVYHFDKSSYVFASCELYLVVIIIIDDANFLHLCFPVYHYYYYFSCVNLNLIIIRVLLLLLLFLTSCVFLTRGAITAIFCTRNLTACISLLIKWLNDVSLYLGLNIFTLLNAALQFLPANHVSCLGWFQKVVALFYTMDHLGRHPEEAK